MINVIEINNLQWRYPSMGLENNPWVIKGINLDVHKGEVLGITGPSGAGKTTLCRLIMGILPHGTKIPFQRVNDHIRGDVTVLSETITRIDEEANVIEGKPQGKIEGKGILSPRIGMVMQDPENQFLQMSLLHELAYGLALQKIEQKEILFRSQIALESVGLGHLWDDAENIHPLDLSGGQKQRVAIAAFLALGPEILLLDEPTSDLDPLGKYEIIQTVRKIKEEKDMTIILAELDPELLYEFCDRVILLDDGEVVDSSKPKNFFPQLDLLEQHGVATFEVSRIAKHLSLKENDRIPITIEEAIPYIKLQNVSILPKGNSRDNKEDVVEVNNLNYQYEDGTIALLGASLNVKRGEMHALIGTNGGGKTTLAKVLAGLYSPSSGMVKVFGKDMKSKSSRREIPQYVGYVFQNPDHQLFTRKVYDEIAYGLENLGVSEEESKEIIERTLQMVGLSELQEEDPLFMGKGQRQRLAVASVLSMGPDLIIVDEPTTGQDFRMVNSIMQLLVELHHQNKTIIIITHDMSIVADYCDYATVMVGGKKAFEGTPESLFDSPNILQKTHLRAPQAFRLGQAMRQENKDFPVLLNVKDWINAVKPTDGKGNAMNDQELSDRFYQSVDNFIQLLGAEHVSKTDIFFRISRASIGTNIDYSELMRVIAGINSLDTWYDSWAKSANKYLLIAQAAEKKGFQVTAGENYLRTALLFHFAQLFTRPDDPRRYEGQKIVHYIIGRHARIYPLQWKKFGLILKTSKSQATYAFLKARRKQ